MHQPGRKLPNDSIKFLQKSLFPEKTCLMLRSQAPTARAGLLRGSTLNSQNAIITDNCLPDLDQFAIGLILGPDISVKRSVAVIFH